MQSLISITDIGTVIAFAVEQQLCCGKVDLMLTGVTGLIGVVSRLTEERLSTYLPSKLTPDQKNELCVFVLAALYSRMTDPKKSSLVAGFKAVQADLMSVYFVGFLGYSDRSIVSMPFQGTSATAPIGPMGPPTGSTRPPTQAPSIPQPQDPYFPPQNMRWRRGDNDWVMP